MGGDGPNCSRERSIKAKDFMIFLGTKQKDSTGRIKYDYVFIWKELSLQNLMLSCISTYDISETATRYSRG